jgi:hypothetical protein
LHAVEDLKKRSTLRPDDLLFPYNHRDRLRQDIDNREKNLKLLRLTFIIFGLLHELKGRGIADNCEN